MKISSIAAITALSMAMAITGCKTLPTEQEMSNIGLASGYTTAYVLNNQVKVDDDTRNAIIDIMNEAEKYIPSSNETFQTTWTPIAQKYIDDLVAKDKITKTVAERVMKDFGYITGLLDKYIEKKGVKEYQNLVDVFIHSFCRSFLTNFKPANNIVATPVVELDEYTEKVLLEAIKKDN